MKRKYYYPLEQALNNLFVKFNIRLDAYEMEEYEIDVVMKMLEPFVDWVKHPEYAQGVPKIKSTGELILDE